MRRYLISKGIPESDIILEDRSATTFENLKNSKDIIDSTEGRKYIASAGRSAGELTLY